MNYTCTSFLSDKSGQELDQIDHVAEAINRLEEKFSKSNK